MGDEGAEFEMIVSGEEVAILDFGLRTDIPTDDSGAVT